MADYMDIETSTKATPAWLKAIDAATIVAGAALFATVMTLDVIDKTDAINPDAGLSNPAPIVEIQETPPAPTTPDNVIMFFPVPAM